MTDKTEQTVQTASVDPVMVVLAGMQLINYIAKLANPNYVPPTPAQIQQVLSKLESEPDLTIYEPPSKVKKFLRGLFT